MHHLLLIGVGGFFGAVARYVVDTRVTQLTGVPWGTLAVNTSGSFLAGLLFALVAERSVLPTEVRGPVMIGFLGSYTTFSALALETWRMVEEGAWVTVSANLAGSLALGLAAVLAGVAAGRAI